MAVVVVELLVDVAGANKVATAGGTWLVSGGIADAVTCLGAS